MPASTTPMCSMPYFSSAEVIMATCAPAIMRLQHVAGVVHAAGDGDVGLDLVIENGGPVQPEAQLMRAAQHQVRHYLHLLQVEVGLIEAIEDDDAVGAGFRQAAWQSWRTR